MKPPACVRNKWGSGTTCERPPDTIAAKEVKSNFEKMMAERIKQDLCLLFQTILERQTSKDKDSHLS